jgi:hypothetical protein
MARARRTILPDTHLTAYRLNEFGSVECQAILQDHLDVFNVLDLVRRMPVDDYQIGLFSCRDRADALGAAETKNRSFAAVHRTDATSSVDIRVTSFFIKQSSCVDRKHALNLSLQHHSCSAGRPPLFPPLASTCRLTALHSPEDVLRNGSAAQDLTDSPLR